MFTRWGSVHPGKSQPVGYFPPPPKALADLLKTISDEKNDCFAIELTPEMRVI